MTQIKNLMTNKEYLRSFLYYVETECKKYEKIDDNTIIYEIKIDPDFKIFKQNESGIDSNFNFNFDTYKNKFETNTLSHYVEEIISGLSFLVREVPCLTGYCEKNKITNQYTYYPAKDIIKILFTHKKEPEKTKMENQEDTKINSNYESVIRLIFDDRFYDFIIKQTDSTCALSQKGSQGTTQRTLEINRDGKYCEIKTDAFGMYKAYGIEAMSWLEKSYVPFYFKAY